MIFLIFGVIYFLLHSTDKIDLGWYENRKNKKFLYFLVGFTRENIDKIKNILYHITNIFLPNLF